MYPRLNIDLKKLKHNGTSLLSLCEQNNIIPAAVTKVFCADLTMLKALQEVGFTHFADSRLQNIKEYSKVLKGHRSILLRLVSQSQVEDVINTSDISLNSEIKTIKLLDEACEKQDKTHGIILMIDLGDLREGIYYTNHEQIHSCVEYIISSKNLELKGIGVNLTCYGSVLPTVDNMNQISHLAKKISEKYNILLEYVSGGNSSALYLLETSTLPKNINNLRLGEALVRGVETAFGKQFMDLEENVITLECEIIELMEKPSMPEGEIGINAFGEKIQYDDVGLHKRAILAIGRQDISVEDITPISKDIKIIGASSDHLIIDVTNKSLEVGDTIIFNLTYGGILSAFTSGAYIKRHFIA